MGHLICTKHGRRSMVLPSFNVIHRSGESCDTETLKAGDKVLTRADILVRPVWSSNGQ